MSQIPAVVSKVKYANNEITIDADIPEAIGSNFFFYFHMSFLVYWVIYSYGIKKTINFSQKFT